LGDAWSDICPLGLPPGEFAGVIARVEHTEMKHRLQELGLPIVNVGRDFGPAVFPRLASDDAAVGRIAAEHLLERNFWQFGFLGSGGRRYSQERQAGFLERLGTLAERVDCLTTPLDWSTCLERERSRVEEWLCSLPRPVGVFVANDILARRVLQSAMRLRLAVPDSCAVVGVGDFELQNELAPVPITSVVLAAQEMGRHAAELLRRMLAGEPVGTGCARIPPLGVIHRRSSDTSAVTDSEVARALRFVRAHLGEGLKVGQLAGALNVSRRWLEGKFREHLGRSPAEVIRQCQMHRARQLLVETDWPLEVIARRCGMRSAQFLSRVFHKEQSMPPSRYRLLFREQGAEGLVSRN
jgi:LacI family transcriptional regulator